MEQEQRPRERASKFIKDLVTDWHPSRDQQLWAVRIAVVIVVLLGLLTLIGLPFGITLWDWIKLLVVPAVLAVGGVLLSQHQQARDRESADRRAKDDALEAYLDDMTTLMIDHHLSSQTEEMKHPDDVFVKDPNDVRTVARARTLTLLRRLDGERKGHVVNFLYESRLIEQDFRVVDLTQADLRGTDLRWAILREIDLRWAILVAADLREVELRGANLSYADLSQTDLSGAFLEGAKLKYAQLSGADLRNADLREADLSQADLNEADLRGADLRGAHADSPLLPAVWQREGQQRAISMRKAGVSQANIDRALDYEPIIQASENIEGQTKLLQGATMPEGQKYEEWVKHRERSREDIEKE